MATKILQFKKRFECWTAGDVAGFSEGDDRLPQIVGEGFAIVLDTVEICLNDPKIDQSWGKRVPKVVENNICPICGKQFKTKTLLTSHKKKDHDIA